MDDNESLASVLGGSSAFHDEVKAPISDRVEQPTVADPPVQARDDSGKYTKTEDPKVAEPPKAVEAEAFQPAHVAAVMDERRKRQALERELEQLRNQPKDTTPPPSVFEDEEGAINHRVAAATTPLRGLLLNQSVQIAQLIHKDEWQGAEEAFHEAVAANPALIEQFRNAENPGEFVYQAGIHHREMGKYGGSVVAMRDAIRGESSKALGDANARVTALEAELAAMKASAMEASQVGKSLNGRVSGAVTATTQTDPEDLKSIVRFGN